MTARDLLFRSSKEYDMKDVLTTWEMWFMSMKNWFSSKKETNKCIFVPKKACASNAARGNISFRSLRFYAWWHVLSMTATEGFTSTGILVFGHFFMWYQHRDLLVIVPIVSSTWNHWQWTDKIYRFFLTEKVYHAIHSRRPVTHKSNFLVHHDNARPHVNLNDRTVYAKGRERD